MLIQKSGNDIEYNLQKLRQRYNVETVDGKIAFLNEAAKLVSTLDTSIERDVYSGRLSAEFNLSKAAFDEQIKNISKRKYRDNAKRDTRRLQANLSRREDKINAEHYKKPRSSSAEEALVIYLINNPDCADEISKSIKPEQFQNSLIKRYYEYFLKRIKSGLDPLTNITADFSFDESSKLYQLMSSTITSAFTKEAMYEYIRVIDEESSKLSPKDLSSATNDELLDYVEQIRKKKQ